MTKHQLSTLSVDGLGKLPAAIETQIADVAAFNARYAPPAGPATLARLTRQLVRVTKAIEARP